MSLISPLSCAPPEPPIEECCEVTITGFCLEDGTPIGIVVQEDEQVGWFNFLTAAFTPGPPPPDIGTCPPNTSPNIAQEILCDLDECGETLATVLVVRIYDSSGVPSSPLYYDSTTGLPYVIQGTLQVCDTKVTLCEPVVICPGIEPIPVVVKLDSTEDSVTVIQGTDPWNVTMGERPSESSGRTHIDKYIENISAYPATIHTVTAGHIFHLTSIEFTALNTSTTDNGRLVIRDNLTVRIPYLVGQASANAPGPIAITSASFPEPIPFLTNVNIQQLGGANTVSISVVGYEENI